MARRGPFVAGAALLIGLLLTACLGCAAHRGVAAEEAGGVLVVSVRGGWAASAAGLRQGDVLVAWSRADGSGDSAKGSLDTPLDLEELTLEQAPRGMVEIRLRRDGSETTALLREGGLGAEMQPIAGIPAYPVGTASPPPPTAATPEELAVWSLLQAASRAEEPEESERIFADALGRARHGWLRARVHESRGEARRSRAYSDGARADFDAALAQRETLDPRTLGCASDWRLLGKIALDLSDFERSRECLERALELTRELAPGSLAEADLFVDLATLARERSDLEGAEGWLGRASEAYARLDPGGLGEAATLHERSSLAWYGGDLERADALARQGLAIRARLAPDSPLYGNSLHLLGVIAYYRSEYEVAEDYYRRALEVYGRYARGSLAPANTFNNLGLIAHARGDIQAAETWYRKVLAIRERLTPDSLRLAWTYHNLSLLERSRANRDASEAWERKALAIEERLVPGTLDLADNYLSMGVLAKDAGDWDSAESWFLKALGLWERDLPDSLPLSFAHMVLGDLAILRGDSDTAAVWYSKALETRRRLAPDSLDVATTLFSLGEVAGVRGDSEGAKRWMRQAIAIQDRLAPGSALQALYRWRLAYYARATGDRERALELLEEAAAAVEAQQARLGGSTEDLGTFREQYIPLYHELVDLLLELGCVEQAFGPLEASRARALLAMLAERDLGEQELSPELVVRRRRANADYEQAMAELAAAGAGEREKVLERLADIGRRQKQVAAEIRAASPRLASLRYPEPLNLEEVRESLGPGDLLLAWSLGDGGSCLLALRQEGVEGWRLEVTRGEIAQRVRALRRLIQDGTDGWQERARTLSALLLGPAAPRIAGARRLILLPDGPLWLLPAQVLPVPGTDRPLLLDHPMVLAPSATVLTQLRRASRRAKDQECLAAFADPVYPNGEVPWLKISGRLAPLPATRSEVAGGAHLYPGRSEVYFGEEASEGRAKEVLRGEAARGDAPSIVHFAAHGLLDEQFPLQSGIALTLRADYDPTAEEPGDNGLLQAWEIFEGVRTGADLVVLSACETGLGKEVAGEGILGLTRAFQFAGSRSVLASLWSVGDASTAELMVRFYRGLASGLPKDEALRKAQLALASGPVTTEGGRTLDATHPAHWAAFQVYGDWE